MARYLEGREGAQAPLPVHSDPLGREFDTRLLLGPVSNDAGSARRQPISFLPYVSRLAVRLHAVSGTTIIAIRFTAIAQPTSRSAYGASACWSN
jgi:hypothetical protein